MKTFLIILAILWAAYRLTPLNKVVNDFTNQKGVNLEETLFDTSKAGVSDLFSEEAGEEVPLEENTNLALQHILLTFVPIIVFVGIAIAL